MTNRLCPIVNDFYNFNIFGNWTKLKLHQLKSNSPDDWLSWSKPELSASNMFEVPILNQDTLVLATWVGHL